MHSASEVPLARRRSALVASLIVVAALLAPEFAMAQRGLSGEGVLKAMHAKYESTWYHSLTFTQQTTLFIPPADTAVREIWKEKAELPGRLRIDLQRANGATTYVFANDSTYVLAGGKVRRIGGGNYLLVIGFDVYRQPVEQTVAALEKEGFGMSPVHEDTWQGRPVIVIGARKGDLHSHQIWIDKENMLFVRGLRPAAGADSAKTSDIRFENYVAMPGGGWLSERVEFYTGDKLRQTEEYSEVATNVTLDPKIFTP